MSGLNRRMMCWEQELEQAGKRLKGKALISVLLRAAWNVHIYHIWKERNNRIFAQKAATGEQVLKLIKHDIRFRLDRMQNVKKDHVNILLLRNWNLSEIFFVNDVQVDC